MSKDDYRIAPASMGPEIDGEVLLSGRGVLKMSMMAYKDGRTANGEAVIAEVCKLLALRRYGKGAEAIQQDIDGMDLEAALQWVEGIWDKYLTGDDVLDLISRLTRP